MEDIEIIKKLKSLHEIKAPQRLHVQLFQQTAFLPEKHNGYYFPLFAFRMGIAFAVLLLFVLATSGIVVAAAHSKQNTPLYPVKVLIQKVAPHFIEQKEVKGEIVPTPTPTRIPLPITPPSGEKEDGKSHGENHVLSPAPTKSEGQHEGLVQEVSNLNGKDHHESDIHVSDEGKDIKDTTEGLSNLH